MGGISSRISGIIVGMRNVGGVNYRVDKNVPKESEVYKINKAADTEDDEKTIDSITMPEWLKYIDRTRPNHKKFTRDEYEEAECIDIIMNTNDTEELIDASNTLVAFQDKGAVPVLIDIINKDYYDVSLALGELGDTSAVNSLIKGLNHIKLGRMAILRKNAARALGMLADERAVPALKGIIKANKEEDKDRRDSVGFALYCILRAMPQGKVEERRSIIKVLGDGGFHMSKLLAWYGIGRRSY